MADGCWQSGKSNFLRCNKLFSINTMVINCAVSLDRISTGTGSNQGGQPSNLQRDRSGKTRSLFVRKNVRGDPVRLAVNVTGSIIADRAASLPSRKFPPPSSSNSSFGIV